MFTCDEHLAGLHPSQGSELCAVVEMMYSLEQLLSITGEPHWGDRLELLAYNALPATFSPDMWTHQYVQQANQVVCQVSPERIYVNNGPEANLFGIEPNYGCCTANLSQGWPKFASHLWMRSPDEGGGLVAMAYAPCEVKTDVRGTSVHIAVTGDYPFDEHVRIDVTVDRPVAFPLWLRIPAWAQKAVVTVAGHPTYSAAAGQFVAIRREWTGCTSLHLVLPMLSRLILRPNGRVAVTQGPLIYSLLIEEDWRRLRGSSRHDSIWEVHPKTPWNVAIASDGLLFAKGAVGERPFSPEGTPVRMSVKGRRVEGWQVKRNAAAEPPPSPVFSPNLLEDWTLIPYGCTNLRVTEFPTL
jgi:DUF1680 family protein